MVNKATLIATDGNIAYHVTAAVPHAGAVLPGYTLKVAPYFWLAISTV